MTPTAIAVAAAGLVSAALLGCIYVVSREIDKVRAEMRAIEGRIERTKHGERGRHEVRP